MDILLKGRALGGSGSATSAAAVAAAAAAASAHHHHAAGLGMNGGGGAAAAAASAGVYSTPHRFEKHNYSTPTSCDYCGHLLWGIVRTGNEP